MEFPELPLGGILDNARSWLQFIDLKFGSGLLKNIMAYVKS